MDLKSLRYFKRVVELGSVTRAAAALNIAQPALTRHIQRLEDEFGLPLLERASRGVTVTSAGELLYRRASGLLSEADQVRAELLDHRGQPEGRVRVGITATSCPLFALPLIQRVRTAHPGISVAVSEGFSRVLGTCVLNGDIDVALMSDSHGLPGLKSHTVVEEDVVFLSAPRRRTSDRVGTGVLAETPLILSEGIQAQVQASLGLTLRVEMQLNSIELIRQLVRNGVGASILPYSSAREDIASGRVAAVQIGRDGLRRHLAVCTPESRPASKATQVVVDALAQIAAELTASGAFRFDRMVRPAAGSLAAE